MPRPDLLDGPPAFGKIAMGLQVTSVRSVAPVRIWAYGLAALIFLMVLVGGRYPG